MPEQTIIPPSKVGALRAHSGGVPQKWFLDDRGRKLIEDLYDGTPERTDLIQKYMPLVPRNIIREWGRKMGKAHSRSSRWTPEEEAILQKNMGKISMSKLSKMLKKSPSNIIEHSHKMGLYKGKDENGWRLEDLKTAFGVSDNTIRVWIAKGWIKGKKITQEFSREVWCFKDKDIREFILAHPGQINQHKMDWLWVVDILAGENGLGELGAQRKGESL